MRLTTVILIATLMQVSASSLAQKITLSEKNASLTQLFKKIKQQAGVDFVVTSQTLKGTKPVSIDVTNTQLEEVLKTIFKDQPLSFTIEDNFVVVSKKTPSFLDRVIARFAAIDIRGKVVGENDEGLAGATVKVKGPLSRLLQMRTGSFI